MSVPRDPADRDARSGEDADAPLLFDRADDPMHMNAESDGAGMNRGARVGGHADHDRDAPMRDDEHADESCQLAHRVGHRVLLASAGTGKTYRLTMRFIALLAAGVRPHVILATTFTRKAAGEIRDRLFLSLASGILSDDARARLEDGAGMSIPRERCREILAELADSQHRLAVLTLDAFLSRLAGAVGLDLGVPPGWKIADEPTLDSLRAEALTAALAPGDEAELLALLSALSTRGLASTARAQVLGLIDDAHGAFISAGADIEAWTQRESEHELLDARARLAALAALTNAPLPQTSAGTPRKHYANAVANLIDAFAASDWAAVLGGTFVPRVLAGEKYDRVEIPAELAAACRPLLAHASAEVCRQFAARTRAMGALVARFDHELNRLKRVRGLLGFDDVPRLLAGATSDHGVELASLLGDVYYRLDARLDHVLLDEFQDTSMMQFALLEPILDEILADGSGSRSVFCVGDAKQSLYTWRDAEPDLLPELPRRWPQLGEPETMSESRRSSPAVLEAVNRVFGELATNEALAEPVPRAVGERFAAEFVGHRAFKRELAGEVRLLSPRENEHGEDAARIALVVERVRRCLERDPACSVGVLVRGGRHVAPIVYALKASGIAAAQEGGNAVTDSAPAAVALSLLRLADHPGESASLFHVATSPLGVLLRLASTPDESRRRAASLAARVRRRVARRGVALLLSHLRRHLAGSMDERELFRFDQLIQLARVFDAGASRDLSEFVRIARATRVEEPARRAVTVMTVHKSKGLEFDAVILPDLDSAWTFRNTFIVDRPGDGSVHAMFRPREFERLASSALAEAAARAEARFLREELCVLYVALTRARSFVDVIIEPTAKGKSGEYPLSAAGVLRAAWGLPEVTGGSDAVIATHGVMRQESELRSGEGDVLGASPASELPASPAAALRRAAARAIAPVWRLRRRSPSSLEGGSMIAAGKLLTVAGREGLDRGTRLHALFEHVLFAEDAAELTQPPRVRELLAALDARAGLAPMVDENGIVNEFLATLTGPARHVLSRARYVDERGTPSVHNERPFAVRVRRRGSAEITGGLVTGRFDRLVVGRDAEGRPLWAEIIDFKTDDVDPAKAEEFNERVEHYRPQLRAYIAAAAALFKLSDDAVRATLLFTRTGAAVSIGPDAGG
jgi:ATP-dependent helicase/nuclease subunit A